MGSIPELSVRTDMAGDELSMGIRGRLGLKIRLGGSFATKASPHGGAGSEWRSSPVGEDDCVASVRRTQL